jgi:hypothetical protein
MQDIVQKIFETPIPTILVIGGLLFLVLSVADKVSSHVVVPEKRKKKALVLGLLLLGVGLVFYAEPQWLQPARDAANTLPVSAPPDFENYGWSDLTPEQRGHWAVLGWTAEGWDEDLAPTSNGKQFEVLSPEEQTAVIALGYTLESWNASR